LGLNASLSSHTFFFYSVFAAPAALFIRAAHGAADLHQFVSERIIILATATLALSATPAACAMASRQGGLISLPL